MFKLAEKKTITWPVTVSIPQDGGRTAKATFPVEFALLEQPEAEKVIAESGDLLDAQVVGWPGGAVQDADGADMPFSEDNKAKLLRVPYVRVGLFMALGEINNGRAAARKN